MAEIEQQNANTSITFEMIKEAREAIKNVAEYTPSIVSKMFFSISPQMMIPQTGIFR